MLLLGFGRFELRMIELRRVYAQRSGERPVGLPDFWKISLHQTSPEGHFVQSAVKTFCNSDDLSAIGRQQSRDERGHALRAL
jgi:hypothetical protein